MSMTTEQSKTVIEVRKVRQSFPRPSGGELTVMFQPTSALFFKGSYRYL